MRDDVPPWYTWRIQRIRRDAKVTGEYAALKRRLWREHGSDRVAYTTDKGDFVSRVMTNSR